MSIMINALAGTGKTFTLIGGARCSKGHFNKTCQPTLQQGAIWKRISLDPKVDNVCFVAFAKSACKEIKERMVHDPWCKISTTHALGLETLKRHYAKREIFIAFDPAKIDKMISLAFNDQSIFTISRRHPGLVPAVKKLASLCKYCLDWGLGINESNLVTLAIEYGIYYEQLPYLAEITMKVVNLSKQHVKIVDFDDMLWLPVVLDIDIHQYDLLVIDECQDLNRTQQEFLIRSGKRFLLAGDRHQAIYGFRGADVRSMDTMKERLNQLGICQEMPLTVSMRCSKAVVNEAKRIVPTFEAHHSNKDGEVNVAFDCLTAKQGDMILCRINAPLFDLAFELAEEGKSIEMLGKDVASTIISMIESMKADDNNTLLKKVEAHRLSLLRKLVDIPNPKQANAVKITIEDRCSCLRSIIRSTDTPDDAIRAIKKLFADKTSAIRLSSVHQAKGLEAENVFIIHPELMPHPLAREQWQKDQEENIEYVAITRARETLTWVDGLDNQDYED